MVTGEENNDQVLDYKTYLRIRPQLPDSCTLYWDFIYREYEYDGKKLGSSEIFYSGSRDNAVANNEYLENEEKYNLASQRIKMLDYNFYHKDILDIHTIPCTYDIVMLSNIYSYLINDWYNVISGDEFAEYVTKGLPQILNKEGIVTLAYQYNYREKKLEYEIKGNRLQKLFTKKYKLATIDAFEKFRFKKVLVPSVTKEYRNLGTMDCVYLYESGKRK